MEFVELAEFPGYFISRDGRVTGKDKPFLKHHPDKQGYATVCVHVDRKMKFVKVHRLLAKTFIPNPDDLPYVDHINRDKADNRLENLRWASRETNAQNRSTTKGVFWHKSGFWRAKTVMKGRCYSNNFRKKEDAEEWLRRKREELSHPLVDADV